MDNAQDTWSLVKTGVVNMKSCRLLLINGTIDGLMPIEDSMLLSEYGSPKEMRLISQRLHMGELSTFLGENCTNIWFVSRLS